MTERTTRIRLGIFVAGALIALMALVILFGGAPNVFSNRSKYTLLFPEAPGVGIGTPVRKSGVRIGDVTKLDLDENTGQVRVSVELERKYLPRLGEEPTISRGLLSGDTTIDFVPKVEAIGVNLSRGEPYAANSEIVGLAPISARSLLKGASDVLPTAQENVAKVVASIQRFEQAVPKVERAIDEFAELARSGREFVPELRQTNIKVQNLLGVANPEDPKDEPVNVRVMMKQIIELLQAVRPVADDIRALLKANGPEITKTLTAVRQTSESANDLLNPENRKAISATIKNAQTGTDDLIKSIRIVTLLVDQAEKTVKEVNARVAQSEKILSTAARVADNAERITKPLADNSGQIVQGVDQTVKNLNLAAEQLNKALGEVRITLATVNRSDGTVQKALTDPTLYNNLNETTVNVARLMVRIERIAKDLEVFADKVARKPETIGIGGALRPSTGLKESPLAPLPPSAPLPIAPTLPLAPGMNQPQPLTPIAPVPFTPAGVQPQTVYRPNTPPPSDLPPRQ